MLFKKKQEVKMEVIKENLITKIIIDYFYKKEKQTFRTELIKKLFVEEEKILVMVDTNYFSKIEENKENQWADQFIKWLEREGIFHQVMKVKKDRPNSILGTLFNSNQKSSDSFAYRFGLIATPDHLDKILKFHDEVKMGVHLALGLNEEKLEGFIQEYCSGMIDDENRFNFYDVDIYDYMELGRMVFNSRYLSSIEELKEKIEGYLE